MCLSVGEFSFGHDNFCAGLNSLFCKMFVLVRVSDLLILVKIRLVIFEKNSVLCNLSFMITYVKMH
jgi:hypothetical protein